MFKFNRLWIMNLIATIVLAMLVACQTQSDTVDLATPTRLAETPTPSATLPPIQIVGTAIFGPTDTPVSAQPPTPARTAWPPTQARTAWRTAISPDGQWLAQSMAEFPEGQGMYRTQLKVMKRDGSRGWSTIQEAPMARGYTTPQPLHWSRDGHYLYFTNRPDPNGCAKFVNGSDLWRINLSTGDQVQVMSARALWLNLSPDEKTVAYIAQGRPLRLVLRDMQTGNERQMTLQVENDALAGRIVWSPDGSALALTVAEDRCRTYRDSYGIMHVKVATLEQTMLTPNDARLLETVWWAEQDKILLRDKDGQTWWLNPATRQLAVATLPEPPINTTQWPTFRSESLGFSLSYPPDWTVSEMQQGVNLDSSESFGGGIEPMQYYVYIYEYPNPQARPFFEVVTAGLPDELKRIFTFTPEMIGNNQAYETMYMPSRSGALTVFFEGDRRYLAIALTPYDEPPRAGQDKYVRLFRALLETIRLTR